MNEFMLAVKNSINRHGKLSVYTEVQEGSYDISSGTVVNLTVNHSVKMYRKNLKINQYNYPALIDKNASMFYICADGLSFTPKPQDKIAYDGVTYVVNSVQIHEAKSEVIMYRVIGVI